MLKITETTRTETCFRSRNSKSISISTTQKVAWVYTITWCLRCTKSSWRLSTLWERLSILTTASTASSCLAMTLFWMKNSTSGSLKSIRTPVSKSQVNCLNACYLAWLMTCSNSLSMWSFLKAASKDAKTLPTRRKATGHRRKFLKKTAIFATVVQSNE